MNKPLVTAIIPLYNGSRYLRQALDSVLSQTYPHIEIIVVDDGSNDDSSIIAKSYSQVIYIHQENQGNALARMKGVELASGELIAFLDQDDVWTPNKIELQVEAFSNDPLCQCVIGKSHYFIEGDHPPTLKVKTRFLQEDMTSYLPGVIMARKELLRRIPFCPSYIHGSDTDWFFRLKESGIAITILSEVLLHVRWHGDNLSHNMTRMYGELLKVIKHSIDRKIKTDQLVSVVIPVLNGEKYLKEAIESVWAQTYQTIEVIVVDDGSTDSSRKIATSFGEKVRYVFQRQGGIGSARNRGVEIARGDYIAFLDCDDLWSKTKLSDQMELLGKDPSIDMAFGRMSNFFSPEVYEEMVRKYRIPPNDGKAFVAQSLLMKRDAFLEVGFFNPALRSGEFIDWFLRAKDKGLKFHMLDQVVLERRIHGRNTTLNKQNYPDYLKAIRHSLPKQAKL